MIGITAYVSGSTIAENIVDDLEEAAQFFPTFVKNLSPYDFQELEEYISNELINSEQKIKLITLGELLIKIGSAK